MRVGMRVCEESWSSCWVCVMISPSLRYQACSASDSDVRSSWVANKALGACYLMK